LITLEGLTVRYGRTIALHRVDLSLPSGIVGMFGPNGSGKSTLLRTVAGLLRPVAGRVTFEGRPVTATDEGWRRNVGYAGHQPGLYEELSIRENLALFARLNGAPDTAVDTTLERIGLVERADDRVSSLSAGLQRRAGVARAMVHDPKVLLLDEPYANLDDDSADRISTMIRDWNDGDRFALVATHGARRLKAFAGYGLVLREGMVAAFRPYEHA
jgi:heme ABC exporter ATP-binding subunit CcmA